ncbi:MAG: ABC transporter substrate-binding protein [Candidimonas sp.]
MFNDQRIKSSRRRFLSSALAFSALPFPAILRAQNQELPAIRYATGGAVGPNEMETLIFTDWMKKNVLKNIDKTYRLDMTFTRGTPEAGTLLAAREADMATLSFAVFASSIAKNTVPGGLSIVADSSREGQPGYHSTTFYVLKDSDIKTVADLKGKRIGINAFGSAIDLMLRTRLAKEGLDPRKDVQIVEVNFVNQAAALRAKRIDLGVIILPFWADEIPTGDFRGIFNSSDSFGTFATIFHVATNDFIKRHPQAIKDFLADYIHGLQWFYEPSNREKAIEICAEATRVKPENLGYFMTDDDYYRDRNGCLSPSLVQSPIDAMHANGILDKPIDVSKYFDLSLLPGACA